jgi:ElaB/YqjD/DUF883 family membrane-anchored ribosome-binding protein
MIYSPEPMRDRKETTDHRELEEKVGELERLADSLGAVPDEQLVGMLNRAVELLREINARLEANLDAAADESREINTIVDGLNLVPFDESLRELERQERNAGEP